MNINFEQTLKKIDGTDLTLDGGKPATLKHFAIEALLLNFNDEREITPTQKVFRYKIALQINSNPTTTDLTVEEIAEIKKLIGKAYGPLVVGQAFQILEGKSGLPTQP